MSWRRPTARFDAAATAAATPLLTDINTRNQFELAWFLSKGSLKVVGIKAFGEKRGNERELQFSILPFFFFFRIAFFLDVSFGRPTRNKETAQDRYNLRRFYRKLELAAVVDC